MRKHRALAVAVLASATLLASLVGIQPTQAATTYEVQVGARLAKPATALSMHFFPETLSIHQHDVLHLISNGNNAVAFLPIGQDPSAWLTAHATGTTGEWSTFLPDPDEGPKALKANPRVALPTDPTCGDPGETSCAFAGIGDEVDGVLGTGPPVGDDLDFTVRITAEPGSTIWAVSLSYPSLRMRIDVVPDADPASDQSAIDAARDSTVATDAAAASALDTKLRKFSKKTVKNGKTTWSAYAGYDTATVSLGAFYPPKLTIRKGDKVQWIFTKVIFRPRSVTFPATRAATIAGQIPTPMCDPDTDTAAAPDTVPDLGGPPFCSQGELELDIPKEAVLKLGNGFYIGGKDLETSGARGGYAGATSPYVLTFIKTSTKQGFKYQSVVPPYTPAVVVVRAP